MKRKLQKNQRSRDEKETAPKIRTAILRLLAKQPLLLCFLLVAVAFWLIFWWKIEIRFFVADLPLLTFFMQILKLAPPYNSYALKKTNSESQKFWSFLKISLKKKAWLKMFFKVRNKNNIPLKRGFTRLFDLCAAL